MVEALIARVEQVEALLRELPMIAAAVDEERVDGATDAASMALRDLLDRIADVAVERYRRDHG
ncbi:hypothetical protein ACFZ8E_19155 [Methylobacterium sp. HMF5984]|uniref:hypothetical protein n=1 Tax=Methylobacterium sp. HMF5984 TaxID=3367370 RepID=UPI0038526A2D